MSHSGWILEVTNTRRIDFDALLVPLEQVLSQSAGAFRVPSRIPLP